MSLSQHSEPLLSESEKFEDEHVDTETLQVSLRPRKWSSTRIASFACILLSLALLFLVGTSAWVAKPQKDAQPVLDESAAAWLSHATRATGDTYLLGVGKADITGYALCWRFF